LVYTRDVDISKLEFSPKTSGLEARALCTPTSDAAGLALFGDDGCQLSNLCMFPPPGLPRQGMLKGPTTTWKALILSGIHDGLPTTIYNSVRRLSPPSWSLGTSKGEMETSAIDV